MCGVSKTFKDDHSTCLFQHKCDLINMSYGEATLLPDYGRFVDLVNEVFSCFLILTRHLYLFFSIFLIIEAFIVFTSRW